MSPCSKHQSNPSSMTTTSDSPLPLVEMVAVKGLKSQAAWLHSTSFLPVPTLSSTSRTSLQAEPGA